MKQLSEPQMEAVNTIDGPVLLVSCPGSGKTTVVINRALNMLKQGIKPNQLLVLTFSRSAAQEMSDRFVQLAGEKTPKVRFSTIHAFCYSLIVRAYGIRSEALMTEHEAMEILSAEIDRIARDPRMDSMEIRDPYEFKRGILREISVVKNNRHELETYQAQTCPSDVFQRLFRFYEREKGRRDKIDFDDMLIIAYELLKDHASYLEACRKQYTHIMVDEYQDTNLMQRDILYLLAGENGNLFVVGDDDQSIYGFRGASPRIMLEFPQQFKTCRKIYMDTNFRSHKNIVEASAYLIGRNHDRFPKDIRAAKEQEGLITKRGYENTAKELQGIADRIHVLMEEGRDPKEMAVLFRNNYQAALISAVFLANKIPFYANERLQNPYEHWIFEDIRAFFRLANGLGGFRDMARVINKPNRFIPPAFLEGLPVERDTVIRSVTGKIREEWKRDAAVENVFSFFSALEALKGKTPLEFLQSLRKIGRYEKYLKDYSDYRNKEESEYLTILDVYEADLNTYGITDMQAWFKFAEDYKLELYRTNAEGKKEGVCVSTMHSAKGLEWPVVFLAGINDRIIPGISTDKKIVQPEEERRLFYVAFTRAKEEVYISYVENEAQHASRFVWELSAVKRRNPELERGRRRSVQRQLIAESAKVTLKKGDRILHERMGKGTVTLTARSGVSVRFDSGKIRQFVGGETRTLKVLEE